MCISRSPTSPFIGSAISGVSTASFSAVIIRQGRLSILCGRPSARSQFRVKFRYQLIPPVKPVRWKVETKKSSSAGVRKASGS